MPDRRTEARYGFERVPGGGAHLVVDSDDVDDVIRVWITGETWPRIEFDPHASPAELRVGDGTVAPSSLAAGTGAPTGASYLTGVAEAGLSAEHVFGSVMDRRDVFANIGNAADYPVGARFEATDTGAYYRGNGAAWQATALAVGNITGFDEAVDDRVAALLVEGTNVTLTYNDGANTLTVDAASGASEAFAIAMAVAL